MEQHKPNAEDHSDSPTKILQRLKQRRQALEKEMNRQNLKWNRELSEIQVSIAALQGALETLAPRGKERRTGRNRRKKQTLSGILREKAVEQLSIAERPLQRTELLELITAAGVAIDKKDPAKFLSRVLWRAPELVNDGDGYWLASRPKPSGR
ncbi:hypothetical protein [Rhizobium sp. BK176]|uniref:hypothetical protein n=1 Tax=Rhizobium sp. BK176 TaxID=2587071 RepID=UPI00216A8471|nr:hypothetical protein [Rhizobium sp. BK176]MCS4091353.1 tRNA A37 threonylcarbamoyltransferase TsaD [Rhizobium sp. BK176]